MTHTVKKCRISLLQYLDYNKCFDEFYSTAIEYIFLIFVFFEMDNL